MNKMFPMGRIPWLAIVIDPVKTLSTGQVEIGAFRCVPKDEKYD